MEKYLSIINRRTFGVLAISLVSTLLVYHFTFTYDLDLTLISIAIVFPLVFTIRSAFKRRDRALEYLSRFRSGLVSVDYSFLSVKKLSKEDKFTIHQQLLATSRAMMDFLDGSAVSLDELRAEASKINQFILDKADLIRASSRLKINNMIYNVHMGIETAASIKQYNTPKSMRAYCLIFIYLYPIMCTPSIYFKLQQGIHEGNLYLLIFLSLTSSFILISLFNVQEQLENPFDHQGLDDIHAESFAYKRAIN